MRAPFSGLIRFDQIQRRIVWRNLDAVGPLNLRCRENADELARSVEPVDGASRQVGEVQPAFGVDRHIVRPDKRLTLIVLGQHFHLARLQVRSRNLRLESLRPHPFAATPRPRRRRAAPEDRSASPFALLLPRGNTDKNALRRQFHDALEYQLREIYVAVAIDGGSFRKSDRRGDLGLLRSRNGGHQECDTISTPRFVRSSLSLAFTRFSERNALFVPCIAGNCHRSGQPGSASSVRVLTTSSA